MNKSQLKDLQKLWYQKLKASGFEDIEDTESPREYLKTWHSCYFLHRHEPETFQLQQEYYRRASHFLHDHSFQTPSERLIWQYHTDGMSQRDIAETLKSKGLKVNSISVNKDDVNKVICKLAKVMKNKNIESPDAFLHLMAKEEVPSNNTIQKKDLITFRPYDPYGDEALIYATWMQGLYHGNDWFNLISREVYFTHYRKVLDHLMKRPGLEIKIACLKEDPGVVLGYSISEKSILHYIFVKPVWRQIGIAKALVPTSIQSVTHMTKIAKSILKKKYPPRHDDEWMDQSQMKFNPFLI